MEISSFFHNKIFFGGRGSRQEALDKNTKATKPEKKNQDSLLHSGCKHICTGF